MLILQILSFLGGIGLFLFGMHTMSEAIRRKAGNRLRGILQNLTASRWQGVLNGAFITVLIQSSGASSTMVLGFLNSGLVELENAISLLMGANVGTCITAWLLCLNSINGATVFLNPDTYVPFLALVGACMTIFSVSDRRRDTGQILFGFACLIYGMDHMSAALEPLAVSQVFHNLALLENPCVGLLVGFLLSAAAQSSSASIGILQAVSVAVDIRFSVAFPLILGMNVGATVIVLISSMNGNKNARRAALFTFLYNLTGAALFLAIWLLGERAGLFHLSAEPLQYVGIALVHTLYKCLLAVTGIPLIHRWRLLTERIIPVDDREERFQLLDDYFLTTPPVAVGCCREISHDMVRMAHDAVDRALDTVIEYDARTARDVQMAEERCDLYEDRLSSYLVKLSQKHLSDEDDRAVSKIRRSLSDLERISDFAAAIAATCRDMDNMGQRFSAEAQDDLRHLIEPVRDIMSVTEEAYIREDGELAFSVEPLEQVVDMLIAQANARHMARLQSGECTALSSYTFSGIVTNLARIAEHCAKVAVGVIEMKENRYDIHRYMSAVKSTDEDFERLLSEYADQYSFPAH